MTTTAHNATETRQAPSAALVVGVALTLCACWMLVWRGSLEGVFHFDDYGNIVDNSRIRQLWPLNDILRNNRPLGLYSFAINYHFCGTEPFAYHIVNLAIHLVNGLLLFSGCYLSNRLWFQKGCSDRFVRSILMASLIATAWVVHPLTTQAVTNVVQRYESLSSLGYLGTWVGLLVYLQGYRGLGCAIILPMAWIGLMSKEVFASAPLVILLFDRMLTQQPWKTVFRVRWLPYLLMVSPYLWFFPSVARFFDPSRTQGSAMGLGMDKISSWEYLRTQPEVIWHYVGLVFWPKDLCFDYLWRIQSDPRVYLPLGASVVMFLGLSTFFYLRSQSAICNQSLSLGGWLGLAFLFVLAPTSSFMPIADIAVEHRMYLASAVVIAAIVLGMSCLYESLMCHSHRPAVLRVAFTCIIAATLSMLAWRTHLRNLDYRSGLVLWSSAARVSPENPRAWYNVGRELYNQGDKKSALRPMVSAVGFSKSSVPIFDIGLADCLSYIGRHQDAITLYERALAKKHQYPEAHNNLGVVFLELNRLEDAQQAFETAVQQNYPEAKYNLALVYLKQHQTQKAVPLLEQVIDQHPEFSSAVRQLAWILVATADEQQRDIERAQQLMQTHYDPNTTQSVYVLDTFGAIHAAKGDFEAAIESTQKALSLAEAREVPNADLIAEMQHRIKHYQDHKPWIGGTQP